MTMPADWTYAMSGGLNYPCRPGESWQCGDAELRIGDLTTQPPLPPARLAYTDPPWNQGNRNSFHTKAGVRHADHTTEPFASFLDRVLDSIALAEVWAIEMGKQNAQLLHGLIAARDRLATRSVTTYYRKHPANLFTTQLPAPPDGLDDDDTPAWCITHYTRQGDLITDPCTGRGLTATTSLELGRRFVGVELSPYRASVTLTKLAQFTNQTPRILHA